MNNCRKCLHFVVCTYNDKSGKEFDCSQAENCPSFRNRCNFIELPCQIGDEKFAILPYTDVIVKGKVCTIIYQNEFLIDFAYKSEEYDYTAYTQLLPEELFNTYEENCVKWKEITMSRDKHIEEMAEIISVVRFHKTSTYIAEALYNAGYRKSTNLAEEIFAEIEAEYGKKSGADRGDDLTYGEVQDFFAELKKKYIQSEDTE